MELENKIEDWEKYPNSITMPQRGLRNNRVPPRGKTEQ